MHNSEVGGVADSLHTSGKAIDLRVVASSYPIPLNIAYNVASNVWTFKVGGVGVYPEENRLHLDVGKCRRWGKVKGVYVSVADALKEIK
jgi:uncharacterized protein YcbK (DUF882 family)